jgi:hypothetical protein
VVAAAIKNGMIQLSQPSEFGMSGDNQPTRLQIAARILTYTLLAPLLFGLVFTAAIVVLDWLGFIR